MKKISTDKAPAAIGPYSQAVISNGLVYTSGQIPVNPVSGNIDSQDIEGQARQAIVNLKNVIEASGSDLGRVIKTTCLLSDISYFTVFNKIYSEYFTGNPARSCVGVSALPKGALVEIEAVAEL